jgi:ribosomal protein S3
MAKKRIDIEIGPDVDLKRVMVTCVCGRQMLLGAKGSVMVSGKFYSQACARDAGISVVQANAVPSDGESDQWSLTGRVRSAGNRG